MLLQRLGNRAACDSVAEVLEGSLDTAVSPRGIFLCHADDEATDPLHDTGPTDSPLGRVGPLGCDELSVPAEDGVGCHDRRDASEDSASQDFALRGETPALVVGEAQTLASELLLEDAVLLDEVGDDIGLVPAHDAGKGEEEDLQGVGGGQHRPILPGWKCP